MMAKDIAAQIAATLRFRGYDDATGSFHKLYTLSDMADPMAAMNNCGYAALAIQKWARKNGHRAGVFEINASPVAAKVRAATHWVPVIETPDGKRYVLDFTFSQFKVPRQKGPVVQAFDKYVARFPVTAHTAWDVPMKGGARNA